MCNNRSCGKVSKLVLAIVACQSAGILGSIVTTPALKGWFQTLEKPLFMPPGWVFGAVLFVLMAVAFWLVWTNDQKLNRKKTAMIMFGVQLALNILWSVIFFGLGEIFWAFGELALLFAAVLMTTIYFFRQSKISGYLMIPYLLWLCAAAYLNIAIYLLN
jgi:benzodiazapine receptor